MSNGGRVLITGSSGFIGGHLKQVLEESGYPRIPYDFREGNDVLDMEHLEETVKFYKPNWIVHLAAQVYLKPSLLNPQKDAMTNIVGTLNVLETARKHDCGVVYSSSGAVYGNNYQYPEPISPYGLSKLTAEKYCQLYTKLYGLHTVVFRFSSVYGPGRARTSINLIVENAVKNQPLLISGDGTQTRDFTHVDDVVEALIMVVDNKFPSGVYDIGTGTATSLNELVQLIERVLGKKLTFQYVPEGVGDPKRNELNVSKAAQYGFKAKTPLEYGLKQLIEEMEVKKYDGCCVGVGNYDSKSQ